MSTVNEVLRWKERRTLLPVWVSMGALFLIGLLATSFSNAFGRVDELGFKYAAFFWLSSCLIGLATGCLLFVPEREQETDLLLGGFPVDSRTVGKVKLAEAVLHFLGFVVVSGLLMVLVLWLRHGGLLFRLNASRNYSPDLTVQWYLVVGLIPVQAFLWSCLCSICFRKAITAVICASAFTIVGWSLVQLCAVSFAEFDLMSATSCQWAAMTGQALLAGVLAVATIRLSATWLREIPDPRHDRNFMRKQSIATNALTQESSAQTTYAFKALTWQAWRMVRVPFLLVASSIVFSGILVGLFVLQTPTGASSNIFEVQMVWMNLCSIAGALAGLMTFRGDQSKNSVLFFQQQGDYPTRVWLSRVVLLGTLSLVAAIVCVLVSATVSLTHFESYSNNFGNLLSQTRAINGIMAFAVAAAVAQLVSIICRSGILAFFLSFIGVLFARSWCSIVMQHDESALLFIGPFVIACFFASWWYAPRWISGRNPIRSVLLPIAVTSLVFIGSLSAYAIWRVNEIPVYAVGADLQQAFESHDNFLAADDRKYKAVFLLREAMGEVDFDFQEYNRLPRKSRDEPQTWSDDLISRNFEINESALEKITTAVADDKVHLWLSPISPSRRQTKYQSVSRLLAAQSEKFRRDGDPEALLDSLIAESRAAWKLNPSPGTRTAQTIMKLVEWSSMKGQTESLLLAGIARLNRLRHEIFDPNSNRIQSEFYFDIARTHEPLPAADGFVAGVLAYGDYYWESIRERRIRIREFALLDFQIQQTLSRVKQDGNFRHFVWDGSGYASQVSQEDFDLISIERAIGYAKIRMALEAWKLQHGEFPDSLEKLTLTTETGSLLESLPMDPAHGIDLPYAWFPDGLDKVAFLPTSTTSTRRHNMSWQTVYDGTKGIPPKTPFLLPYAGSFSLYPVLVGNRGNDRATVFRRSYVFENPPGQSDEEARSSSSSFLSSQSVADYLLRPAESGGDVKMPELDELRKLLESLD
ncbi:hypothetical protein [Mariniblastus fucicola]|uniref:ABC-2 family transporter protein n=1 Tax=Mariniblastus fucicola TaxID=980251 RepID=A0A5B9P7A5_9BACT|nr:hypothetical protein [Mariniblastus fucicola]QEG22188.1 hypothetical protein MFFC18_20490 [Mariniblastus fucicola]